VSAPRPLFFPLPPFLGKKKKRKEKKKKEGGGQGIYEELIAFAPFLKGGKGKGKKGGGRGKKGGSPHLVELGRP